MKTFYTVRDIEDMQAAGVVEIQTHDDVVLTDVAREKAIALGMRLVPMEEGRGGPRGSVGLTMGAAARAGSPGGPLPKPSASPLAAGPHPRAGAGAASDDLVRKVKAAVVARLGTDKYNDLLDGIIAQVMSQLKK